MAVTQGLGDGYALYNGVKLPDIDKVYKAWTDKKTHPYAYIIDNLKNDEYLLTLSSQEAYVDSTNSLMTGNGAMLIFKLTAGSDSYSLYKSSQAFEHSYSYSKSNYSFVWANHDILKDSTVYYSATDPIPLDGMTVIEWDGDTTGLEVLAEDCPLYKVTDAYIEKPNDGEWVGVSKDSSGNVYTLQSPSFVITQTIEEGYMAWALGDAGDVAGTLIDAAYIVSFNAPSIPIIGTFFNTSAAGTCVSLFAYTPAAEPETPKWQFNLQDLLSGMASAAASRGVLRRTPIAYLYNGVQLPALPESSYEYAYLYTTSDGEYVANLSPTIEVIIGKGGYSTHRDGDIYVLNDGIWEVATISKYRYGYLFWSNTDVYYDDAFSDESFASTLYLAASDPVPVYK